MANKETYIQSLNRLKREYWEKEFEDKYPNGVYSLQIRHGASGYGDKDEPIMSIQLRWGKKHSNFYYKYATSFTVSNYIDPGAFRGIIKKGITVIKGINNSFKYTYNYNTLEKLLTKCTKENVSKKQIEVYLEQLKK